MRGRAKKRSFKRSRAKQRWTAEGVFVGVRVVATSSVSFNHVMVQARRWAVAADGTDIMRDNTAMLISGCFWLSFEKSEFLALMA